MAPAKYKREADDDLREIVAYIACDSLSAAIGWLIDLRSTCELIATQPGLGELVETAALGKVRRHALGNYVIYYRPTVGGILVLRILHGAREQE